MLFPFSQHKRRFGSKGTLPKIGIPKSLHNLSAPPSTGGNI